MPNPIANTSAGTIPNARPEMKMREQAESVTPKHSDMILPERVIKVIPTATQPIKDIEVNRATMLGVDRNPGVARAPIVKRRSTP